MIENNNTVPANKPDIVVKNMKDKKCVLIDVSVPCDANLISKEAEKKLKYRTLAIEDIALCGSAQILRKTTY
ncbi:hypothetical protein M8J77_018662 [Diaphorina citri]|nr:hypothetical protein M8J77_018662 [Diaphorina citri]